MGLTYRKSIRFGKYFRLNFSKRGTSVSVGPRGAKVNIGSDGKERVTVSKGGLRYTKQVTVHPSAPQLPPSEPAAAPVARAPRSVAGAHMCWVLFGTHYLYLGKFGLQLLYWVTLGGVAVWAIVDLFRIPGMVRRYVQSHNTVDENATTTDLTVGS